MTTLTAPTSPVSDTLAPQRGRTAWAAAGALAALGGVATMLLQGTLNAAYDSSISGDPEAIAAAMAEVKGHAALFHLAVSLSAVLLLPFGAGLVRRLRRGLDADSLLPWVAGAGVLLTSAVLILGSGLDTEFGVFPPEPGDVPAEHISFYGHWIGTIPWLWTGLGATAGCVALAGVRRVVPRWHAVAGFVLGGATLAFGVSPMEYMALLPATLWLLVTGLAFTLGDRRA
ncbi:hypothetical protein G5V58_17130 [Nocardioides anomalus]|uniref:DUF4386 family protein n=1 Tax=Nocardioides anomalus TaxID=2712223 RepID=A0A6G6WGD0_9ACTN|nr:hypothetical protein [Nocardioides anomalus]QIG44266.1 hypothetical protein G5V58_17130 [Nocardioides anomalus]